MTFFKTPVAAERAGTNYHHLMSLIRCKRIRTPAKDSSGDYVWTQQDIEAAREVIEQRNSRKSQTQAVS